MKTFIKKFRNFFVRGAGTHKYRSQKLFTIASIWSVCLYRQDGTSSSMKEFVTWRADWLIDGSLRSGRFTYLFWLPSLVFVSLHQFGMSTSSLWTEIGYACILRDSKQQLSQLDHFYSNKKDCRLLHFCLDYYKNKYLALWSFILNRAKWQL